MGLRRRTKLVANVIKEKSKRHSETFFDVGRAFIKGILDYREEYFGDPTYIGSGSPAGMTEHEFRTGEFRYGLRAIQRSLGFEGPSYLTMDMPGKEYIEELRGVHERIDTTSIGTCAMLILRNQYEYTYTPGQSARGYAVFGRLLISDRFLMELGQVDVAEAFFQHLARICAVHDATPQGSKIEEATKRTK